MMKPMYSIHWKLHLDMTFSTGIVENHYEYGHLRVWQTKTQDFAFASQKMFGQNTCVELALSWFNTAGYIKGAQNALGYNWSNGDFWRLGK